MKRFHIPVTRERHKAVRRNVLLPATSALTGRRRLTETWHALAAVLGKEADKCIHSVHARRVVDVTAFLLR